ncbi:DEAD/DEAH box helicase [Halovenus sp. WSH3]|uniref:DEAD/DEAH box helicase n=1 Tax=Halovenus carboxidivorans TaxID=2692199 RepID=A0A6B0TDB9_9EURY|nr:DEAD/DEAH box helicase [Halovenus carboxidivorans]MXR52920.1 DEAD/DEAH box helicase [Halovenus carboxidivorans]
MAATDASETIERPLVTTGLLERRSYQTTLADRAAEEHSLVCLPTGLGKTAVSLLVTADRLANVGGKSLLLAPTKPLVSQHAEFYREGLEVPDDEIVVFTGDVRPDDRAELWEDARVVIATPQVVENDLVGNRISLAAVTHCTFDECHRATGEYAYNYIAERYHEDAENPLVTAMSASPGDDEEAILEICSNLGVYNVEVMTEADADVSEYTHETTVNWERLELPQEITEIRDLVQEVIRDRLVELKDLGVTGKTAPDVSEREIQKIQGRLQQLMDSDDSAGYEGMSYLAEVRKLRTAMTYIETQSVESFRRYMDRQKEAARSSGASKADQRMVSDPNIQMAIRKSEGYDDLHPKFRRARMLIAETLGINDGERVIVFTESRDTAEALTEFLDEHFTAERFVGQSDTDGSDGMTQTEQQETLDRFRAGEFEVLVSTSVAEEGLDVPEVDLVLFYEPVPTAIRAIQRKGRTGRQTEGAVTVLLAEDTRDEAYFWKARQDQKQMKEELRALKSAVGEIESALGQQVGLDEIEVEESETEGSGPDEDEIAAESEPAAGTDGETEGSAGGSKPAGDGQTGLHSFAEGGSDESADDGDDGTEAVEGRDEGIVAEAAGDDEAVEIVADQRELDSTIARDLSTRDGIETRLETLAVGDYVLSDRVVVERKTVEDFLDTLTGGDRSMFEQVGDAARNYGRPVVVIEGGDLYGERNVHPKAIHGALASLTVDFGASVMQTADEEETADLLEVIASREQEQEDRSVSVHGEKQSKTLAEQQEYVVASIAEVGPVTARALLEAFGSVEAVMTADEDDLLEVEGVGPVTAERMREVISTGYTPEH